VLMWRPQTQRKQGQAGGKMLAPLLTSLRNSSGMRLGNECDRGQALLDSDVTNARELVKASPTFAKRNGACCKSEMSARSEEKS